jgi:hypothetical protein
MLVLQPHAKPGDFWLFVRCGSLLEATPGPGSAALAVLQLWQVGDNQWDYSLWRLDEHGLPTGHAYFSLTGECCCCTSIRRYRSLHGLTDCRL